MHICFAFTHIYYWFLAMGQRDVCRIVAGLALIFFSLFSRSAAVITCLLGLPLVNQSNRCGALCDISCKIGFFSSKIRCTYVLCRMSFNLKFFKVKRLFSP